MPRQGRPKKGQTTMRTTGSQGGILSKLIGRGLRADAIAKVETDGGPAQYKPEHPVLDTILNGGNASEQANYLNTQGILSDQRSEAAMNKLMEAEDYKTQSEQQKEMNALFAKDAAIASEHDELGKSYYLNAGVPLDSVTQDDIRNKGIQLKHLKEYLEAKYGESEKKAKVEQDQNVAQKSGLDISRTLATQPGDIAATNEKNSAQVIQSKRDANKSQWELDNADKYNQADLASKTALDTNKLYSLGMVGSREMITPGRDINTEKPIVLNGKDTGLTRKTQEYQPPQSRMIQGVQKVTPDEQQAMGLSGQGPGIISKELLPTFGQTPKPVTTTPGVDPQQTQDLLRRILQSDNHPAYSTEILEQRKRDLLEQHDRNAPEYNPFVRRPRSGYNSTN